MAATLTGELAALMDRVNDPANQIVAHLGKNPIPSSLEAIGPADLVECDFPGYEAIRLENWRPIFIDDDNYGEADSGEVEWDAGKIVTPQAVTCVYVTSQTGAGPVNVMEIIVLEEPETMANEGDLFWYSFRMQSANIDVLPDVGDDA